MPGRTDKQLDRETLMLIKVLESAKEEIVEKGTTIKLDSLIEDLTASLKLP